jgi:hypothetical protein
VLAKSKRTLVKTTTAAIIDSGGSGAERGGLKGEWMRATMRSLGAEAARRRERRDGRSVRSILMKIKGLGGDGSVEDEGLNEIQDEEHGI